ncbi:HesB/IscA family protein [Kribbella shirazensis]|uniref:Iron-sulfur cluster assembly accessory protein n=1 Tax=Kribbella shirazensis TaxID=1105143 RepID=A0A7X5VJT1_9ACTN|nr:iron-sulfur cluster assembly accessory protein [Kribbella shirazensis]NIK61403.1 iron-sulfur cluster assembly accessory protein [Kribbella shirazensis]
MSPLLPSTVQLTARAAAKFKELDTTSAQPIVHLYVAGRTCCGVQYGMSFAEQVKEGYSVSEVDDVRLVVDPVSLPYCEGVTVDFMETQDGSGFKVEGPGAAGIRCTCGGH